MLEKLRKVFSVLPLPIRVCWCLNLILDLACVLIMGRWNFLLHRNAPYRSPVMHFQHWWDFSVYAERFQHFHRLEFFTTALSSHYPFEYPAPAAVLYALFYLTSSHPLRVYLGLSSLLLLALSAFFLRELRRHQIRAFVAGPFIVSTLLLSYPFWFEGVLGNIEIYVFFLLAAAAILYVKERPFECAAVLGLAASLKFYPAVYLGVFLSRRRYKPIVLAAVIFILSNFVSLWAVGPTIPLAYRNIRDGLAQNKAHYMLNYLPIETGFDHSLFGLTKRLYFSRYHAAPTPHILTTYLAVVAIGGLVLYTLRIRKLPLLNQVLSLCVASILLPPTSHDYTLIHLYLPWAILVLAMIDYQRHGKSLPPGLMRAFICFGVLFAAESELIHSGSGYSGQIKCLFLVALLCIALLKPWNMELPQSSSN